MIILGAIALGLGAKYVVDLNKEKSVIEEKLKTERTRVEYLKRSVEADERKLDMTNLEEKRRKENLEQLILAKKKELENVDTRINELKQNPDVGRAKQDADADLKLEKEKVDTIQNQIKSLEQSKGNRRNESHDDQRMIEERFRTQDANLNYQIKAAEDTLHGLENDLRAIKIARKDPIATSEKASKSQEIVNQRAYISDLRRQKNDLSGQHAIQKNNLGASVNADQGQLEQQITGFKNQLKVEKARYETLDKTLKSFANSEEGVRNQLKILDQQKQSLQREISDLQASH